MYGNGINPLPRTFHCYTSRNRLELLWACRNIPPAVHRPRFLILLVLFTNDRYSTSVPSVLIIYAYKCLRVHIFLYYYLYINVVGYIAFTIYKYSLLCLYKVLDQKYSLRFIFCISKCYPLAIEYLKYPSTIHLWRYISNLWK